MTERPADYQTTSGHGHVTPRRDGVKARCGGPAICSVCAKEQAQMDAIDQHPTPVDQDGHCWYCSGGLGHGPHGHLETCPLVAIRKLAPTAEGEAAR